MIALRAATVSLGGQIVLRDMEFSAGASEFIAVCGPNGAGKTTFLKAVAGLLQGGVPNPRQAAYVEQNARCSWAMTVQQVAELGRVPHGDLDQSAVEDALQRCGLSELRDRRVDRISGGQARRAMLARAFATRPAILLLDEPVADLDPASCHAIMALLADFARTGGLVITVLHAIDLALRYCTRMVVFRDGRMVADDAPLAALPAAAAAFGLPCGIVSQPGLLPPDKLDARGQTTW